MTRLANRFPLSFIASLLLANVACASAAPSREKSVLATPQSRDFSPTGTNETFSQAEDFPNGRSETSKKPGDTKATIPIIIVTPNGQRVDLGTIAGTIDAFSGEELAEGALHNTMDLQYAVPGLVFKSNTVLGQPYLRGVGSELITAGAESSVATFVDGVYLPRSYDTILPFFDIARVEIFKGPQAVQLGRNVVGGAVSLHTRKPGFDHHGYARLSLGNYGEQRLEAAGDLPLNSSNVALRLAGLSVRRDGFTRNIFLDRDMNDAHHDAYRASLLYTPADNLKLVVSSEHRAENSTRGLGLQPAAGIGRNGGIELGGVVPGNPREVTGNVIPKIHIRSRRDSARLSWHRPAFDLLATTAHVSSNAALALDLDGTNAAYAANFPSANSSMLMQEIRLTSARDNALSWTAGVFVLDEKNQQILDTRLAAADRRIFPDAHVATHSYALFGELAYRFSARWQGSLGMRLNQDSRHIHLVRTVSSPSGTTISIQDERRRWRAVTPQIKLRYQPRDHRLYYLTGSRGYKPGGFNTSAIQPPFDPELLHAWEAGLKFQWPNRAMRLNAAAFFYRYADMQFDTPPGNAPVGTFPMVINAARSSIRGLDVQFVVRPGNRNTQLTVGATLLDARFRHFVSVDPNRPSDHPVRDGKRMPQAPKTSFDIRLAHTIPLAHGQLSLEGGYRYQSAMYFDIYQDSALHQKGYGLFNARIGFEDPRNHWTAAVYGRNLTNTLYAETILRRDPLTGTKRFWGAPRTLGLEIGYPW